MLDFDLYGVDWKGLAFSGVYILVLGGALVSFSHVYRRRKAAQSANLAPWFGPHLSRDIYLSLVNMSSSEESDGKAPSGPEVPDTVLRAALLRRAVESLGRLIQVRLAKQAITGLLARGSVGDDLHQRLQRAEKEIDLELRDVVNEANAYAPGWGPVIFSTANEMYNNSILRGRLNEILSQTDAEKEWWEKRRESIRSDFMKEIGDGEGEKEEA